MREDAVSRENFIISEQRKRLDSFEDNCGCKETKRKKKKQILLLYIH